MHAPPLNSIAFVGSYVPRRCGIATFTHDLRSALAAHLRDAECIAVPLTDGTARYDYPSEAAFEIRADEPASYERAAAFLNLRNIDVVSLQHEYGIFGGEAGGYVLALLENVRAPIHTTLHTVLARPSPAQRRVMDAILHLSARVAVMTDRGRSLLEHIYGVPAARIDVIPHGIPDTGPAEAAAPKHGLGLNGRSVLLTFGLLSPAKGIEHVIEALPRIAADHPRVLYAVLGATHPHLAAREGERYRDALRERAAALGVEQHVVFHDRYVDLSELLAFLSAADIYITPYLNEDQITSGTLAYAFGCGKPVISTPYWHAQELLADDHGVLVPFSSPAAIATAVCDLLGDDARRQALGARAWQLGRGMVWSGVAARYDAALRRTRESAAVKPRRSAAGSPDRRPRHDLPPVRLDHLLRLTDSTGLLQHATYDIPNAADGYCTDDNARALALMVALEDRGLGSLAAARAATVYATFLGHAFVPATGRFRNFLSFDRRWLDDDGTDDCLGRAVTALGACIGRSRRSGLQAWAMRLFLPALEALECSTSPRAWALGIIGIQDCLRRLDGSRLAAGVRTRLTQRLVNQQRAAARPDWPWPEEIVAYDNARLCQALISSGRWTGDRAALQTGLADRTNDNQGAESTLAWIGALVEMQSLLSSAPRLHERNPHRSAPGAQQRPRPLPALRAAASPAGDEDHRPGSCARR